MFAQLAWTVEEVRVAIVTDNQNFALFSQRGAVA